MCEIGAHKRVSENRKGEEVQRLRCRAFLSLGNEEKIQDETGPGRKAQSVRCLP